MKQAVRCPACGKQAKHRYLQNRADHEYGIELRLDYWRCDSTECGHVFVDPMPNREQIAALYGEYSTHALPSTKSWMTHWIRWLDAAGVSQITALPKYQQLRCLDYGCGNGTLLSTLAAKGMTRLAGYDFDPAARQAAQSLGMRVHATEMQALQNGPYDLIVMNHVVEHLPAPAETLGRLSQCLANGGRLLVRTPNAGSLLARCFGPSWRGWETPRHLHIFTAGSFRAMAQSWLREDLRIAELITSNAMFPGIFHASFHGKFWRGTRTGKLLRHTLSLVAWPCSLLINTLRPHSAEELCCVIVRGE